MKSPKLQLGVMWFLSALFIVIGVLMVAGLPKNDVVGVRTAYTFSSPEAWRAVNAGTGLLLATVAIAVPYLVAPLTRSPRVSMLLLLLAAFVVATLAGTHPEISTSIFALFRLDLVAAEPSFTKLAVAIAAQTVLGAVGAFLLSGYVPPNGVIGLRTPPFTRSTESWFRGNRIGGAVLLIVTLVGTAGLLVALARGWPSTSIAMTSGSLLIVAAVAAWGIALIDFYRRASNG